MSETGAASGAPASGASTQTPSTRVASIESLVDDALGAMAADGADELEQSAPAEEPAEDEGEGAEVEAEDEGESEEEPAEGARGSEQNPFSVQDLPEDKHIKLKVDGREETVSLRELGNGYIREQTMRGRIQQASDATRDAGDIAQRAVEWQKRTRENVQRMLSDAESLYDYFVADDARENVLKAVATRYARLLQSETADATKRLDRIRARDSAKLASERSAFEADRRRVTTERENADRAAARSAELRPGWEAGLREAGLIGAKLTSEFHETVRALLDATARRTKAKATADDLRQAVVKTAKLLGLQKQAKPTKAPVAPPQRTKQPAQPAGRSKAPRPGSIDAIMSGLKPRRF